MQEQLDPGYETGEVPRRPDTALDVPWRPSYMQPAAPVPPSVVRAQPTPQPRPAEMREYRPTTRERDVAKAQSALEGLGMERAGARRISQTVLGGPQSSLPLGVGLMDIPLLPALPYFMEEGYRSTERAAGALERGEYGTAALEYLGAVGQMLPGAFAAREVAPGVAKVLKSTGVALGESMAANAVTSPMARGQRGVFVPEAFFTPQEKAKISAAQELEAKGTSPDDVLVQTGLVRDLDGSWAVEISDDRMKFRALEAVKAAREPIVQRISELETAVQVREILERGGSMGNAARTIRTQTGQDPSPRALELAQKKTVEQLDAALENANNSLMAPIRGLKMKDVVEHPELFDRIPELAEMQVDFITKSELGGAGGHMDAPANAIRLQTQYMRPGEDYGRSIMAHELQHSIDYRADKDYGIATDTIKQASDYWKTYQTTAMKSYSVENTALYARELMEKNPGMTAEEALDKTLENAQHYGSSKDYAKAGRTIDPENGNPYTEEGDLRGYTIKIIDRVPLHEIQRRADEAAEALQETRLKSRIAAPTEAGRYEQYMTNVGEARARLAQTRLDLTPEERLQMFPMREQFMGLDRPPESLKTIEQLTGGLYGSGRQAAAPAQSMEPPAQMTLREALADQPTTLRTLENLPGKRTMIPMQEIRDQLRRPEVTKAERDVFERVLARTEGDSISAENLVREVGLETKDFTLTPQDTDRFADYGLEKIDRVTGPPGEVVQGTRPDGTWGDLPDRAVQGRTTIHRSPTPTADNNHFGDPNYFGHTRAFEADGIPHVVEIQSDLVQKAGKELAPEERARVQETLESLNIQYDTINSLFEGDNYRAGWARSSAGNLLAIEPELLRANPDFTMLLEASITEKLPPNIVNEIGVAGGLEEEGSLLRYIQAGMPNLNAIDVANVESALRESLKDGARNLGVLVAENSAKLQAGGAEAQRPMFKNWERRLIREELSRAATPQFTKEYADLRRRAKDTLSYAKRIEEAYRETGASEAQIAALTAQHKQDAEYFAKEALKVEKYRPLPPVVRFADADTVALVEGWERKLEFIPGEARDYALEGQRMMGTSAGTANDWKYTGMVRMDRNGIWEAERVPIDVDGRAIGPSTWGVGGTSRISQDIVDRFVKPTDKFEYPEHQGIYDRYKKEVTNYLKSLGGKQVKDRYGHSWWEVPVKPEQKRTQLFSMGGGAVAAGGAAAYNAEDSE